MSTTADTLAQRLYNASEAVKAASIAPWVPGTSSVVDGYLRIGSAFRVDAEPSRPWQEVFVDVYALLRKIDNQGSVDEIEVQIDSMQVLAAKRGGWTIFVAVTKGAKIRKSLKRMVTQSFKRLAKIEQSIEQSKVVHLRPVQTPQPSGTDPDA